MEITVYQTRRETKVDLQFTFKTNDNFPLSLAEGIGNIASVRPGLRLLLEVSPLRAIIQMIQLPNIKIARKLFLEIAREGG